MYSGDEAREDEEREHLFKLIREMVKWENSNNSDVINRARLEIARSVAANMVTDEELADDAQLVSFAPELPEGQAKYLPNPPPEYTPQDVRSKSPNLSSEQVNHFLTHYAPPVLDPFAGGGSIPLEAQRLGLRAYASDLNPVPVLINKALIEIPPKFAGQPPVNPEANQGKLATKVWHGAEGLAEDVRYYGKWMRDEAEKRIGHLYPNVKVTQKMVDDGRPDLEPYVGQELTVIAWIWCRTVKSPNPAVTGVEVPLIRSFWLSKKKGQEAYIYPVVDREAKAYSFKVKLGKPSDFNPDDGLVSRKGGRCLLTDAPMPFPHIRSHGQNQKLGVRLMAMVAQAGRKRIYLV
jgi:putative DNA methylase